MKLVDVYDCVVMVTMSDWRTEAISNRFHYATRFCKHVPTFFVQFDAVDNNVNIEATSFENLYVVHIPPLFQKRSETSVLQFDEFSEFETIINSIGGRRRLVWVFNPYASVFIKRLLPKKVVFHATELYALRDSAFSFLTSSKDYIFLVDSVAATLEYAHVVACVSDGVAETLQAFFDFDGEVWMLRNGCDAGAWIDRNTYLPNNRDPRYHRVCTQTEYIKTNSKVAIYQGGINNRLDFELLYKVAKQLPDWTFALCGPKHLDKAGSFAHKFLALPNVVYHGDLPIEEIKKLCGEAAVGLIPFIRSNLIYKTLPLKSFEYIAAGLPVITVEIEELEKYPGLFDMNRSASEFSNAIKSSSKTRYSRDHIAKRLRAARKNSWDANFDYVVSELTKPRSEFSDDSQLNVLVLYSDLATHIRTIRLELEAFRSFSRHNLYFLPGTNWAQTEPYNYLPDLTADGRIRDEFSDGLSAWDLSIFDAVIIHYSIRVTFDFIVSDFIARKLHEFQGPKVLFIQDEYEKTEIARKWMELLGVDIVYTCVPDKYIERIYPADRYPKTEFINVLTGYVTPDLRNRKWIPLERRDVAIGYRGRPLSHRYGKLGFEKRFIGQQVRKYAEEAGLNVDIEWSEEARIYGPWLDFLGSVRATLATESGSNMFDFDGHLDIKAKEWKDVEFQDAYDMYFKKYDNHIKMNQVSPKIFESIAVGTLLICFEGEYSGVIQPNIHFIPLKKDFSNIDTVFENLMDDDFVREMTERSYNDIILSGKYDIEVHISRVDDHLSARVPSGREYDIIATPIAVKKEGEIKPLIRSNAGSLLLNNDPLNIKGGRKNFLELYSDMEISANSAASYDRAPDLLYREHLKFSRYDTMGQKISDELREARLHKLLESRAPKGAGLHVPDSVAGTVQKAPQEPVNNIPDLIAAKRFDEALALFGRVASEGRVSSSMDKTCKDAIRSLVTMPNDESSSFSNLIKAATGYISQSKSRFDTVTYCNCEYLLRRSAIYDDHKSWLYDMFTIIIDVCSDGYDYRVYMAVYYYFTMHYKSDSYASLHGLLNGSNVDQVLVQMHQYCLKHAEAAAAYDKKQGVDNSYMRTLMTELNRSEWVPEKKKTAKGSKGLAKLLKVSKLRGLLQKVR